MDLLLLISFAILIAGVPYIRNHYRSPNINETPILLAYYTENAKVVPAKSGEIAGMKYNSMVTLPNESGSQTATLIHVQLPFATKVHLLGISKKSGGVQIIPTAPGSVMEEVVLEGDYPNYFSLYADKNLQSESRYVMDPTAMWFTVEFCQSHNWEIINGDLYFVQDTDMLTENDPTHMWGDIESFVREIRPSIELVNPDTVEATTSQEFDCPICREELVKNQKYFVCSNSHGILLHGSVLMQGIESGELKINKKSHTKQGDIRNLACPSCGNHMQVSKLRSAHTQVDRCISCPYVWLDEGELIEQTKA